MARIAHIADLHLSVDEPIAHGIDLWEHFESVLAAIAEAGVELMIVGGDLALKEGDPETYRRIAKRLDTFPADVLVQPGNHDRPELFAEAFGRRYRWTGEPLDRVVTWRGFTLVLLDSSSGSVSEDQLSWLESVWRTTHPAALFLHHPVTAGICRYMEINYELRERDHVYRRIASLADEVHVFSGHYHVAHDALHNPILQHVTPAVFYQLDSDAPEFAVASSRAGYRIIDLSPEGISTAVGFAG